MLYRLREAVIDAMPFTGTNADAVTAFAGGLDRFHLLDPDDEHRCGDPQALAEVWDCEHGRWMPVRANDVVVRVAPRHTVAPLSCVEFAARYEPNTEKRIA